MEFAKRERVEGHAKLAKDFTERVLGMEWAWISDESRLSDFHGEKTDEKLVEKILDVCGVDVSDLVDGRLVDVFDRIAMKGTVQ